MDDADERVIVAIFPGLAFGGREDAVECLDACVAVARIPAGKDGLPVLGHGVQGRTDRFEQVDVDDEQTSLA